MPMPILPYGGTEFAFAGGSTWKRLHPYALHSLISVSSAMLAAMFTAMHHLWNWLIPRRDPLIFDPPPAAKYPRWANGQLV
jgi:hypothetical protein